MKKPAPPADVCCSTLRLALTDERFAIVHDPVTREIFVRGVGHHRWVMKHCCWCGTVLPRSLSVLWYRRMKQLGALDSDGFVLRRRVPRDYRSDAWWRACAIGRVADRRGAKT